MAHEYGAAWSMYHLYISQQGSWNAWLTARGLLGDPRVDSSFSWSKNEMIADDYRMLFGSPAAQSEGEILHDASPAFQPCPAAPLLLEIATGSGGVIAASGDENQGQSQAGIGDRSDEVKVVPFSAAILVPFFAVTDNVRQIRSCG